MSTLTVGAGQTYTTIAAAVGAAQAGDTINVQSGTYTNDFLNINKSLTLNAVGGVVTLAATVAPPNGKAILDEGGAGVAVSVNGFAFTGAAVSDMNGAGIRYEGGALTVSNSHFFNNQDGILAASDPNGTIAITNSEFDHNGAGDGFSHNMYINDVKSFTLTNSYIHDASVGHEIKSRAESTTITGNRIFDNNSTSSYEIDLPNGGNAVISGNTIQQSAQSGNPTIIAYGEEGNLRSGTSLSVSGNTIVNDKSSGAALWNSTTATASFTNNSVYGFGSNPLVTGAASQSGTTVLGSRPVLDLSAPALTTAPGQTTTTTTTTPPPTATGAAAPATGLVVNVSEDAWSGDAQFTVTVDGKQVGGTYSATASHASGATQAVSVGTLAAGTHQVGISFINDAYGGTAATDRNLYVAGATYNGQSVGGSSAALYVNRTSSFGVTVPASAPAAPVTSTAVVNVSEDAYLGDAQFTVAVDGKQMGGTYTATALHNAGQTQAITVAGIAESFTPHDIAITFLNDAYGGSPATDRNLYVSSIRFDNQAVAGSSATMFDAGTKHFTAAAPSGWTG